MVLRHKKKHMMIFRHTIKSYLSGLSFDHNDSELGDAEELKNHKNIWHVICVLIIEILQF